MATTLDPEVWNLKARRFTRDTHRIQSRRADFFKNFLVRYLRYRFDRGILEVTVICLSPTQITGLALKPTRTRSDRTFPENLDVFTKIPSLVVDLDPVVQELFECSTIENTISGGTGVVDSKFVLSSGNLGCLWLKKTPISLLRR